MSLNEPMVMGTEAFDCGIQKSLINAGKTPINYVDGTKVYFHYKTVVKEDGTVLDDSKKLNEAKPMEIIIGKKFKLEIWERALRTMWLNEVARFSVDKQLVLDYPMAAKQLREYYKKITPPSSCGHSHEGGGGHGHSHDHHDGHGHSHNSGNHHVCGFNILEHGVGYDDLDKLLKSPKDLDFIFELVKVQQPGEYKKESWALSDDERMALIPELKEEGNRLFKAGQYDAAKEQYQEALGLLEQFMLREKPNDVEWNELNALKLPILLNFSMCHYQLKDFYECIKHTSDILEGQQPKNVKALFRRAKARSAVWQLKEARDDFETCRQLDSSLSSEIDAQLVHIAKLEREQDKKESEKFRGKLF